jgi:hypothetical protein
MSGDEAACRTIQVRMPWEQARATSGFEATARPWKQPANCGDVLRQITSRSPMAATSTTATTMHTGSPA